MTAPGRGAILIALAMFMAASLAVLLKPTQMVAGKGPDLEAIIPAQFGDWRMVAAQDRLMVNPELRGKLDRIYGQTLSRTYTNKLGDSIMLSLAYGANQSDTMVVHKPEVCYPAQGFQVIGRTSGVLPGPAGNFPVERLVAVQGARIEPITYWVTVGGEIVRGPWSRKLVQMKHALTGQIPDGLLFRVSSIDPDRDNAFRVHARFVSDLIAHADPAARARLFGQAGS